MNKIIGKNHQPIARTDENPFKIQHNPTDYYSPNYLTPTRMSSYAYQYSLALETGGRTFLNIGSANPILKFLIEKNGLYELDLDLDCLTKPDITAAFQFLPFSKQSFDVVMCFQMLEHLPSNMFQSALIELKRISKQFIILSLPDQTLTKVQSLKYSIHQVFKRPTEWNIYKPRSIDSEHFWEIGHQFVTDYSILKMIESENLNTVKHFRNPNNKYHHFFLIEVKEK